MNSNSKSVNSTAIKAEIKRHDSLQSALNRLSKQLDRVGDQQLRSGLKVYLHSIQGKLDFCLLNTGKKTTCSPHAEILLFLLTDHQDYLCAHCNAFLDYDKWEKSKTVKVGLDSQWYRCFFVMGCEGTWPRRWLISSSVLPVSACLFRGRVSLSVFIFFLISLWRQKFTSWRLVCSDIYLSVSLWTWATNGNIPQQPSPWQQDETCCAAYFLSANLQPPSKPLPFRRTGPLHVKLISFTSFPLISTSHPFLLMWHNVSPSVSLCFLFLFCVEAAWVKSAGGWSIWILHLNKRSCCKSTLLQVKICI